MSGFRYTSASEWACERLRQLGEKPGRTIGRHLAGWEEWPPLIRKKLVRTELSKTGKSYKAYLTKRGERFLKYPPDRRDRILGTTRAISYVAAERPNRTNSTGLSLGVFALSLLAVMVGTSAAYHFIRSEPDETTSGEPYAPATTSQRATDVPASERDDVESLVTEARELRRQGHIGRSQTRFDRALDLVREDPMRSVDVLVDLADLAIVKGSREAAEEALQYARAAAESSDAIDVKADLACGEARIFLEMGEVARARLSYSECSVLAGSLETDHLVFQAELATLMLSDEPPSEPTYHRLLLLAERTGREQDMQMARRISVQKARSFDAWRRENGGESDYWEWIDEVDYSMSLQRAWNGADASPDEILAAGEDTDWLADGPSSPDIVGARSTLRSSLFQSRRGHTCTDSWSSLSASLQDFCYSWCREEPSDPICEGFRSSRRSAIQMVHD